VNSSLALSEDHAEPLTEYKTVMSSSATVGEVGPMDPFNSNDGAQIVWRGEGREFTWHRVPKLGGYRSAVFISLRSS
jgi:hypothetical protein